MKFFKYILVLCLVLLSFLGLSISRAKADGGIFYPPDYYMNETGQKAVIYFQNQTENLVVSTSFSGNSKDFAWVIPTPTKPEVFKSSHEIFTTLQEITKTSDYAPQTSSAMPALGLGTKSDTVQVIEEKTIDIYDTAVLKATDDKALAGWLKDHGYNFPQDKSYMLQEYINNGWYFTIAKIQNTLIQDTSINNDLSSGTITPLRLKFSSDKIIYPMKLTRLALDYAQENVPKSTSGQLITDSYSPTMQISLYVLSDSKTTQDKMQTQWANWINSDDIASLNTSVTEDSWISGSRLFLTKMSNDINIKDIDNDFLITKAPNNKIYPVPVYQTFHYYSYNFLMLLLTILIAIFSPIGLIFIIAVIFQLFASHKKWLFILGNIYQVLACFITLIIGLLFVLSTIYSDGSLSVAFSQDYFIGLVLGLLLVLATEIFFTAKMLKKYKSTYNTNTNSIK